MNNLSVFGSALKDFDKFLNQHTMHVSDEDWRHANNRAYAMCLLAEEMKSLY